MGSQINPFHLKVKVKDLESTRKFYCEILGCNEEAANQKQIELDFFGNQLSAFVDGKAKFKKRDKQTEFGCYLSLEQFSVIRKKLEKAAIAHNVKHINWPADSDLQQFDLEVDDFSGNSLAFTSLQQEGKLSEIKLN
ncbi:MAG: dioxygenase [Gammaproteobacteria bacterium]|nr:dioxygenase [Gammaproteobacteria bacterium]